MKSSYLMTNDRHYLGITSKMLEQPREDDNLPVRVRNLRWGVLPGRRAHSSPGGLAPVEGCCRASASLLGFVGQVSSGKSLSGKTRRARLVGQD
ncbi:hypothetical protein ACFX13_042567 [Malus domestica]